MADQQLAHIVFFTLHESTTANRAPPATTSASPNPRLRSMRPMKETRLPIRVGHVADSVRGETGVGLSRG